VHEAVADHPEVVGAGHYAVEGLTPHSEAARPRSDQASDLERLILTVQAAQRVGEVSVAVGGNESIDQFVDVSRLR